MRRSSLCERDIFCFFVFFIVLLCRKMFLSCSCSSRWCLDSVDTFKTVDKHTAEMCCWNVTQRCLCPAALYYHQRPYKGWKRHLNPSWLLGQMARHPVINTWADYEILGPWAQTRQSPPRGTVRGTKPQWLPLWRDRVAHDTHWCPMKGAAKRRSSSCLSM